MADLGFAKGIFGDRRAARRSSAARRRPDTLTELRWHQPLPADGNAASAVSAAICAKERHAFTRFARSFSAAVLPTLAQPPALEFEDAVRGAHDFVRAQADDLGTPSFVDLKTGMRLRYLRWGGDGGRAALLLHGLGDCAGVLSGLGRSLASRGFCVYAYDCRGHGDSTRSAEACYDTAALAEDLESLVLELDLYVAPLALVGFGLGATVAAAFAAAHPALVGGVALCELWAEPPADAGFHPGQAARFESSAQAAAFLCADCWGHPPRPLGAVVRHNAWRVRRCASGAPHEHELKLDARFLCAPDADGVRAAMAGARCHLALLFGTRSHAGAAELRSTGGGVPPAGQPAREAAKLLALATSAASTALLPLAAGHYLLEDAPLALRDALASCLTRWAEAGALDAHGPRAPEALGLRPLPQFDSLEDARRALRPRAIPTRAVVDAVLAELRQADEAASSDDEADAKRGTALSNQPREYFGFVG